MKKTVISSSALSGMGILLVGLCALLTTVSLAAPVDEPNPSAFLTDDEFRSLASQDRLTCSVTVVHPSRPEKHIVNEVRMHDAISTLHKNAMLPPTNVTRLRSLAGKGIKMTIAVEDQFHRQNVIDMNRLIVDPATVMLYNFTTPAEYLCFEVLAAEGRFDAFMPFNTDTEAKLASKYSLYELEGLFGMPFIMPDRTIVEVFSNKSQFASWMREHGFGRFVPETFRTAAEATFPCLVKATNGIFGEGISIVRSAGELRAAIAAQKGSYLIQEAILGPVELVVIFAARKGQMLGTTCGYKTQNTSLFVNTQTTGKGGGFRCLDLETYVPVLDLTREIVKEADYNGFGCLNFKVFDPVAHTAEGFNARFKHTGTLDRNGVIWNFDQIRFAVNYQCM